jgi:hypothetical protein
MKNRIKLAIATEHKANKQETVTPLETVCFTSIVKNELTSTSIFKWHDLLNFIAGEHNLRCRFSAKGFCGSLNDYNKAKNILINSVQFN